MSNVFRFHIKQFAKVSLVIFLLANRPIYAISQYSEEQVISVSPSVVKLAVDEMFPFCNGYAVVKKGNKSGIIDKKGRMIIPYEDGLSILDMNHASSTYRDRSSTDFFVFKNQKNEIGFITPGGMVRRLPAVKSREFVGHFNEEGKTLVFEYVVSGTLVHLLDSTGKMKLLRKVYGYAYKDENIINVNIPYPSGTVEHADNTPTGSKGFGYISPITGQFVIQPQFAKGEPFSEGMAAVMKLDEFGKEKWGFIDLKGNLIVPMIYSKQPQNFSCGFALVTPNDQSDFDCAFINKKGEMKIKINTRKHNESGSLLVVAPFTCGITYFGETYKDDMKIMDTAGKVLPIREFLSNKGINGSKEMKGIWIDDIRQGFMYIKAKHGIFGTLAVDLINTQHQLLPYDEGIEKFNYDVRSGLRYYKIPNRASGKEGLKAREGYINSNNEFVIIKEQSQKW